MKRCILPMLIFFSLDAISQKEIPDVYSVSSNFERIEIIRMRSGADMLEGLQLIIKEKQIKNAVFLAGIGSVTDYHIHVVSDKNLPPGEEFPKASVAKDLVSVQGYVFNGRVHAHISLSDENSMIGGHLEPGTKALTFFIITLGVLPNELEIENFDNYQW